jgi:hypothetical protein
VYDAAAASAAAYAATSLGKTAIMSVDGRGAPLSVIGWLEPARPRLSISGDRLVAWDGCGCDLYEVAPDGTPIKRGHIGRAQCDLAEVAAMGNLVLAGKVGGGLLVIDATDPAAPRDVAGVPVGGPFKRIRPVGGEAFVLTGGGVALLDLTDPLSPAILGFYNVAAAAMTARGRIAFVVRQDPGRSSLEVVSFQDPAAPRVLAGGPGGITAAAVDAELLGTDTVVAVSQSEADVYELTDPPGVRHAATFRLEGRAGRLAPSGDLLLAAAGDGGLLVLGRRPDTSAWPGRAWLPALSIDRR